MNQTKTYMIIKYDDHVSFQRCGANDGKSEVEEVIIPFNKKMDGVLRIVYSQNEPIEDPYYDKWIFGDVKVDKRREFKEFEITQESAIEYVYYVSGKAGIIALLKMALKEENRYLYDISDFLKVDSATEEYKRSVIDGIFDELVTSRNYSQIIQYLRESVANSEKLSLEFNINSRTTARQGAVYKNVGHLSLGQKVVAMLDFVLGYGDFIDDNRPILIDQPEDNLDSQYIYMNLVHQLRDIKDKRQVIIATHNATIVTNAMADQVCVMLSDGKNGWIDKAGYPSEDSIKKEIINYLEGGKDSFRHKMKVYEPVLS